VLVETVTMVVSPHFLRAHFSNGAMPHSSLDTKDNILLLLKYCLSDLTPSTIGAVHNLPLVPLSSNGVGSFLKAESSGPEDFLFLCDSRAQFLMSRKFLIGMILTV
jgi:hypothetical protein